MKTASQLPPSAGLLLIPHPCGACAGATTGEFLCPASPISLTFGEWLMPSSKAPRRVIASYGEERQRSMRASDAAISEQNG
ncbi:hypothetical protein C0J26_06155 [Pseudomonas baetica]|nr:hypothetical protein C0J26_06155 [Pseudomonas baetica]